MLLDRLYAEEASGYFKEGPKPQSKYSIPKGEKVLEVDGKHGYKQKNGKLRWYRPTMEGHVRVSGPEKHAKLEDTSESINESDVKSEPRDDSGKWTGDQSKRADAHTERARKSGKAIDHWNAAVEHHAAAHYASGLSPEKKEYHLRMDKKHRKFYQYLSKDRKFPEPKNRPNATASQEGVENEARDKDGKWTPSSKHPSKMTAKEINSELDKHDAERSAHSDRMIAAGRGHEKANETYAKAKDEKDELAQHHKRLSDHAHALRSEIAARYGPNAPSRLPTHKRGAFGPRASESLEEADSFASLYQRAGTKIRKHLTGVVNAARSQETPKTLGGVKSFGHGGTAYGGEKESFLTKLKGHFAAAVKQHRASRSIAGAAAKAEAGATDSRPKIGGNPAGPKAGGSFAHEQSKKALMASKTAFLVHKSGTQNPTQLAKVHRSAMALHRTAKSEMENIGEKDMAAHHEKLFQTHRKALHKTRTSESVEESVNMGIAGQFENRAKKTHQGGSVHKAMTASARAYATGSKSDHDSAGGMHLSLAQGYRNRGRFKAAAAHEKFAKMHEKSFGKAVESVGEDLGETNTAIGHSSIAHDASARAHKSNSPGDHKTAIRLHYRAAETHNAAAKASTPGTAAHAYHLDHAKAHTEAVAKHRTALKGTPVMAGLDINARLYEGKPLETFPEIKPVLKESNDEHDKDTGQFSVKHYSELKTRAEGKSKNAHDATANVSPSHKDDNSEEQLKQAKQHQEAHKKHLDAYRAHMDTAMRLHDAGRHELSAKHNEIAASHARQANMHRSAFTDLGSMGESADLLSRIYEGDTLVGDSDKKSYLKNNTNNSSEYDDDFDDEDWMLDDDEEFADADDETTLGKPSDNTKGKAKSKKEAEVGAAESVEEAKGDGLSLDERSHAAQQASREAYNTNMHAPSHEKAMHAHLEAAKSYPVDSLAQHTHLIKANRHRGIMIKARKLSK